MEGQNVDILLKDGRILSALVTGINSKEKFVTVAWVEHNHIKLKRVLMTEVIRMNPELSNELEHKFHSRKTDTKAKEKRDLSLSKCYSRRKTEVLKMINNIRGGQVEKIKKINHNPSSTIEKNQDIVNNWNPISPDLSSPTESPSQESNQNQMDNKSYAIKPTNISPTPIFINSRQSNKSRCGSSKKTLTIDTTEDSDCQDCTKEIENTLLSDKQLHLYESIMDEDETIKSNVSISNEQDFIINERKKFKNFIKINDNNNKHYNKRHRSHLFELQTSSNKELISLEDRPTKTDSGICSTSENDEHIEHNKTDPLIGKFKNKPKILVCVRKRPRNSKEIMNGDIDILTIPNHDHIILSEPRQRFDLTEYLEHTAFRFDYCFDETSSTKRVYQHSAAPMVESIFEGSMATCFAYGQTGSGKTFTMGGPRCGPNKLPFIEDGIYGMVVADVFELYQHENRSLEFTISVNFFEIYGNKVHDLLNRKRVLRVLEDSSGSVQLLGLREYLVQDVATTLSLLKHGYQLRTNGQTLANESSSRSHAVFQINVRRRIPEERKKSNNRNTFSKDFDSNYFQLPSSSSSILGGAVINSCTSGGSSSYPNAHYSGPLYGRFSLVDLAGNERSVDSSQTHHDRVRHLESGEINKSLLALKECIRAMGNNGTCHLPFRSSKLTQVLRESFVGQRSRTCMIATISPCLSCCEHSLNTLRYAQRVKHLPPSALTDRVSNVTGSKTTDWLKERERELAAAAVKAIAQRAKAKAIAAKYSGSISKKSKSQTNNKIQIQKPVSVGSRSNSIVNDGYKRDRISSSLTKSSTYRAPNTEHHVDLNSKSCNIRSSSKICRTNTSSMASTRLLSEDSSDLLLTDIEPNEVLVSQNSEKSQNIPTSVKRKDSNVSHQFLNSQKSDILNQIDGGNSAFKLLKQPIQYQIEEFIREHNNILEKWTGWINEHRKLIEKVSRGKLTIIDYLTILATRLGTEIGHLSLIKDKVISLQPIQN